MGQKLNMSKTPNQEATVEIAAGNQLVHIMMISVAYLHEVAFDTRV